MVIGVVDVILVEEIEQTLQVISGTAFQIWNLNDDAVVRQAFDELVPMLYHAVVIVQVPAADVDHRFVQFAQFMPKNVD